MMHKLCDFLHTGLQTLRNGGFRAADRWSLRGMRDVAQGVVERARLLDVEGSGREAAGCECA